MRTIKLVLQYDGTRYAGWQRQNSRQPQSSGRERKPMTVQEEVERALEEIVGHAVRLTGSGRTDAGVHAQRQVAHFTTSSRIEASKLLKALNRYLPGDIGVSDVVEAGDDFHARFSARAKTYRYILLPARQKHIFLKDYAACVRFPLSLSLMRREARCLIGRHDFSSFQASDRVARKSTTRIDKIRIVRKKSAGPLPFLEELEMIVIDIEAAGFLRGMVRNIVGTLIEVGRGKLPPGSLRRILKQRDRRHAGFCAPARGLYLTDVRYE